MAHLRNAQHWVLLGTSPASEKIWGLREINFPCGYMMPPGAFALPEEPLERPRAGDVWAMGGFSLELARGGKRIKAADVDQYVAGYRPWVCLFHHTLLDELTERGHTIETWDRGVSIFHGLWNQSCQKVGNLISASEFSQFIECNTSIEVDGDVAIGVAAKDYAHNAAEIVHFMSQFMTLSEGDQWIQGPLVAHKLRENARNFVFKAGSLRMETGVF